MKKRNAGFTLIELLMAATLTAMVVGGAFVSLSVVLKAYKEHGRKANTPQIARLILERMRTDLQSTFLSPHDDRTRFVAQDFTNGEFSADTLTFISAVNKPMEYGAGTSDLAEVQYYIDQDDATPEKWLLRRFDPTPDSDPFSGGEAALLGPKVVSLDFQFYDGEMWWPEWDSMEEIPICVYAEIGLFEPERLGDTPTVTNVELFSTMIWIASYREPPEDSLGPMGGTEALEEETAGGNADNGSSGQGGGGGQGGNPSGQNVPGGADR